MKVQKKHGVNNGYFVSHTKYVYDNTELNFFYSETFCRQNLREN